MIPASSRDASFGGPASVSLIVATTGRWRALRRLISSVSDSPTQSVEVIVVEQKTNESEPNDGHPTAIQIAADGIRVRHVLAPVGLSIARNVGLEMATGDIVGFPDDDCWYPPDVVARVASWFREHPEFEGLCGRLVDERGGGAGARWARRPGRITTHSAARKACSATIFMRRRLFDALGGFDETLGLGAPTPWQSGEETDLVLRALQSGAQLFYEPSLTIGHPARVGLSVEERRRRARSYGRGYGRVMRLHRFPYHRVGWELLRPAGRILYWLAGRKDGTGDIAIETVRGRWEGWRR